MPRNVIDVARYATFLAGIHPIYRQDGPAAISCHENRMRERLLNFLRKCQVVTVTVVEPEGTAHAAALFYAVDDELNLYVLTDPRPVTGERWRAPVWWSERFSATGRNGGKFRVCNSADVVSA